MGTKATKGKVAGKAKQSVEAPKAAHQLAQDAHEAAMARSLGSKLHSTYSLSFIWLAALHDHGVCVCVRVCVYAHT